MRMHTLSNHIGAPQRIARLTYRAWITRSKNFATSAVMELPARSVHRGGNRTPPHGLNRRPTFPAEEKGWSLASCHAWAASHLGRVHHPQNASTNIMGLRPPVALGMGRMSNLWT